MVVYVVTSDSGTMSIFETEDLANQYIENLGLTEDEAFIMPWSVRTEANVCEGEGKYWVRGKHKASLALDKNLW